MQKEQNKTILEFLNELPEPYKDQAIANYKSYYNIYNHISTDHASALGAAFSWSGSREGNAYWEDLYRKLVRNKVNLITSFYEIY